MNGHDVTHDALAFLGLPHLAYGAHMPQIMRRDLWAEAFELFETVKKEHAGLPFIFLTAVDDFYARKFGREMGGAAYITKPVDLDELERIILEKIRS